MIRLSYDAETAGLCATCVNMRSIVSDRGSVFYLCELSKTDARFPKYPRLPIIECSGYQHKENSTTQPRG
jgi:hypothetical protein